MRLKQEKVSEAVALLISFLIAETAMHPQKALGTEWVTTCGRIKNQKERCRVVKGDAVLNGLQGMLFTIVFSNGEKRQFFTTPEDTARQPFCRSSVKVRKVNGAWLSANVDCWDDNGWTRQGFQLPSGDIFMYISEEG
jgi:hypothetical protein